MNRGQAIVVRRRIDEVCTAMRNLFDVNYTPYMVRDSKGIDEKDWFDIDWDKLPLIVSPRNEEYKFKDAIKICSRFNRDVITPGVLDEVEEYVYNGTDTDTAARFAAIDTGEICDWITMSRAKFGDDFDWETMEDALCHLNKFLTDLRQYAPTAPGVDLVAVSDRAEDDEKSRADLSGEADRNDHAADTSTKRPTPRRYNVYLSAFKDAPGKDIIKRATAAGYVQTAGDVWQWMGELREWVYFAVEVTLLLNLRPSNGNVEWKPIGAIFGMMDEADRARNNAAKMRDKDPSGDVYADKWNSKPENAKDIDWILEGD